LALELVGLVVKQGRRVLAEQEAAVEAVALNRA
jgi:hypothetical protein